jgi:hypothetical protein
MKPSSTTCGTSSTSSPTSQLRSILERSHGLMLGAILASCPILRELSPRQRMLLRQQLETALLYSKPPAGGPGKSTD